MIHWDDLRIVLAIARAGSLSGAARQLAMSHPTVFRRLNDIEQRLGVSLFERSRKGYAPTVAGDDLAATAARMEDEVLGAERRVMGRDLALSGTIRVTTTDTLLMGLLSPIFAGFRRAHPEIELEVAVSNQLFNLTQRDADVAVRPSSSPPENLVGRRIGMIAQAAYAQRGNPPEDHQGKPAITSADWIGPDPHLRNPALARWMAAAGVEPRCHYRIDTTMGMLQAVRDGMGLAVLPRYIADADDRLERVSEDIPELNTELWLLTHPDLRRVARVRAFFDLIAEEVRLRL